MDLLPVLAAVRLQSYLASIAVARSLTGVRQSRRELFEQFRMGAGADEHNHTCPAALVDLIGQKKITAHMTLAMPVPFATQRMIPPCRTQRAIVGDQQQQHGLVEPIHVVPAGS